MLRLFAILFVILSSNGVAAYTFPIKSKADAIEVAKSVCLKYGGPLMDEDMKKTTVRDEMSTFRWDAALNGDHWDVSTTPSIYAGTNDHMLDVEVPVNGPEPRSCSESLYTLFGVPPRKPKDRTNCEPSDISAANALQLAFEAYMRGVWTGGIMAMKPESELDAWTVSIRVAAAPGDNSSKELGHYRVLKRTANVVDIISGEEFNSLPSKAHYLELHCLDKQPPAK
jgi:hypothetical protein